MCAGNLQGNRTKGVVCIAIYGIRTDAGTQSMWRYRRMPLITREYGMPSCAIPF